jgi:type 1 glutamine amidotransferase
MKGVTPLLRTVNPKSTDDPKANNAIIAWSYQREGKGRSFTFTGTHLHASYEQAGYRKFLVNGILWAAGIEIPATGAPCELKQGDTAKYLSAQK